MADKEEIKRLEQEIKRANRAKDLERAREEYVRLLEQDDWRVTTRAPWRRQVDLAGASVFRIRPELVPWLTRSLIC